MTANSLADVHREMIITLAARSRLAAIYPFRYYATSGGLISYALIWSTRIGGPPPTSIVSSRAKDHPESNQV